VKPTLAVLALLGCAALAAIGCSQTGDATGPITPPAIDGPCSDDTGDRFVDCGNGTVTDTATGLIWLEDFVPGPGWQTWDDAMTSAAGMRSGMGGLSDHSSAGSWRLPTRAEWYGVMKPGCYPALPDRAGTGCFVNDPWKAGTGDGLIWSSETTEVLAGAWLANLNDGTITFDVKTAFHEFWLVRGP
jgi:hypothetical protein